LFRVQVFAAANTPSLAMDDAIPEEEKGRRLAVSRRSSARFRRPGMRDAGQTFEVLVSGKSRREYQWSGTPHRTA